eukprot:scaffold648050_cov46-Prasinocladus_malaysianus.AAC.1
MSEKDIDEKVQKLQHKLEHTSVTLNEEKQIIQQLKDLEKSRALVSQYAEQMDKMSNSNDLRESVIADLKARDDELQQIKDRQKELQDKLGALREKENANLPNVPQLMLERKECYEVIKAAKHAKSTLYNERKAALDEYYQREREVKRQIQEERKARWEQRQKEYEARQKERKAREEAEKGEPFEDEVWALAGQALSTPSFLAIECHKKARLKGYCDMSTILEQKIIMCDQLVIYLNGLLPKEAASESQAGSSGSAGPAAPEAGMKLVKKKNAGDDEMEAMFAGLGGGKKGGKKGKKAGKKDEPVDARIQHSIDTLSAFSKLKVDVPLKSTDVPAALEGLKAAKEGFLVKRVAEKERRAAAAEAGTSDVAEEEEEAGDGDQTAAEDAGDELSPVMLTLSVVDDNVELALK